MAENRRVRAAEALQEQRKRNAVRSGALAPIVQPFARTRKATERDGGSHRMTALGISGIDRSAAGPYPSEGPASPASLSMSAAGQAPRATASSANGFAAGAFDLQLGCGISCLTASTLSCTPLGPMLRRLPVLRQLHTKVNVNSNEMVPGWGCKRVRPNQSNFWAFPCRASSCAAYYVFWAGRRQRSEVVQVCIAVYEELAPGVGHRILGRAN